MNERILMLETSTKNCSVALAEGERVIFYADERGDRYLHSERLHSMIDELMKKAGWNYRDLSAVAVGAGPGSYTGLRIGVSAAKGLAFALDIPLISVPTLEILARGIQPEEGVIVPMIDARRMEVYTAVYDKQIRVLKPVWAEILTENSFREFLERGLVYFAGDALDKAKTVLRHPNAVFTGHIYPQAKHMLSPAIEKFRSGAFENTAYFEPFYLKSFVAKKKKNPLQS